MSLESHPIVHTLKSVPEMGILNWAMRGHRYAIPQHVGDTCVWEFATVTSGQRRQVGRHSSENG
jgi:hypothetical protein